jgi:hypothetical protein
METLLSVRGGYCFTDNRVLDAGGEHSAELLQRLDTDLRLAERERSARACIAHPPRNFSGNPGTGLKVEDVLSTTATALDDPEPLSMKRMPWIRDGYQLRSVC